MLRYWFRVFALGVLEPEQAKSWEATLFGAINPQKRGWVIVRISSGKVTQREPRPNNQGRKEPCGEQEGSTLVADSDNSFWNLPPSPREFHRLCQQRLQDFYTALATLGAKFNYRSDTTAGSVSRDSWAEAVDANCRIVVCAGDEDYGKPYALAVLRDHTTSQNYIQILPLL